MPDVTGQTALDVAIGLFFLYFLMSTVCSAIHEFIAGIFGWRAKNLQVAIHRLLVDPPKVTPCFDNPRIQALGEPVRERKRTRARLRGPKHEPPNAKEYVLPSYIPAKAFALAALDTFSPDIAKISE